MAEKFDPNYHTVRSDTALYYGWYGEKAVIFDSSNHKAVLSTWHKYKLSLNNNWKSNTFVMYCRSDKAAIKVYNRQFNLKSGYKIENLTTNTVLDDKFNL